jgi:DNA polymerase III delta subunit
MDARKPSPRSPTKSSPARSKAGSREPGRGQPAGPGPASATRASAAGRSAARPARHAAARHEEAGGIELLERFQRGDFPPTLYLEGPSEALKTALLAELRRAWARTCPEAPLARVFRAAESGVEEILAAFQGSSLFSPRDLILVLEVEDLARSEKRVAALAAGLRVPGGGSCLVLHESEADTPRKSLEPLRAASAVHWLAAPPARAELVHWGERRLAHAGLAVEPGVVETVADACEGDPLSFFNELEKLDVTAVRQDGRRCVTREAAAAILKPVVGADLPEYLSAVALGRVRLAGRALSRLLAEGVEEGTVLWALANLVGGALGGWAKHPELSAALRRRLPARELARALDAVYRAEAAWKGGRADAIAVLELATRAVCGT